ncbi:NAD(P)H-binding protein [Propionibacterium sp.]|uniref:NmrA family NAD(P)-binding protein n=1 Tax=Propionibacterium sp. TaxID=1977903 RepID=UPI0039E8DB0E
MIWVTGASGRLASGVIERLRARGADVVGASRTPGEGMRRLDFDEPDSLDFRGADTLVLVSAGRGEDDVVIARHRAVVDAAVRDGVSHLVYTSVTTAGEHLVHAVSHRATERLIRDSGVAWTILRNGMYAEAFAMLLAWGEDGVLESPYADGVLAAVARADLAEAAAFVVHDPAVHAGQVYDLVGRPMSTADVAEAAGVGWRTIRLGEFRARLEHRTGLLPVQREMALSIASNVRHGFLADQNPQLEQLIGRYPADPVPVAADVLSASR